MIVSDNIKQQIIIEARTWIGTPWAHNQRLKGVGVDCVQFLAALADKFGIEHGNIPENYPRMQTNDDLFNYLNNHFKPIQGIIEDTDILIFNFGGFPHHVGLVSHLNGNLAMIHASDPNGVIEHEIDRKWRRRIICGFKWS